MGVILDVAVSDSVVYLLDRETHEVRAITLGGRVLPSIGRPGEGPGDLSHPQRMTLLRDGRCVVVQTFSRHAVCLTPRGDACGMFDLSAMKEGYASTIWVRAASGRRDELILASVNTLRPVTDPGEAFDASGRSASVRRLRVTDGRVQTLFTTDRNVTSACVVFIPQDLYAFVVHGWDVAPDGRMLFADPGGEYRVTMGHPCDGEARVVDLPEWDGDDARVRELARRLERDPGASFPRIASLHWVDGKFFLVKPAAHVPLSQEADRAGTYELFDEAGSSYGRYDVRCEFDPENDQLYLRGNVLVLVRGGQAVARSVYRDVPGLSQADKSAGAVEVEEVRVQAYQIFGPDSPIQRGR